MISLLWVPTWRCNNYGPDGQPSDTCPYCWFNFDAGAKRLVFNGRLAADGQVCDPLRVVQFLRRNQEAVCNRFVIGGGGEPLMHPQLPEAIGLLARDGFRWGMTSNTLQAGQLQRIIGNCSGSLATCDCWTVSIHAYGEDRWRQLAENVRTIKAAGVKFITATIVVSRPTLPILANMEQAARSLPFDRVQYHIDETDANPQELIEASRGILPVGGTFYMVGYKPQGVFCSVNREFLVVAPMGIVYQCMRKACDDLDPLGPVEDVDLAKLPRAPQWCDLACGFGCDQAKHIHPVPPRPIVL